GLPASYDYAVVCGNCWPPPVGLGIRQFFEKLIVGQNGPPEAVSATLPTGRIPAYRQYRTGCTVVLQAMNM
ncbi:MAG: hypothetical protein QM640_03215, partial [Niabella sp.]